MTVCLKSSVLLHTMRRFSQSQAWMKEKGKAGNLCLHIVSLNCIYYKFRLELHPLKCSCLSCEAPYLSFIHSFILNMVILNFGLL